jgi:hypothetical protein
MNNTFTFLIVIFHSLAKMRMGRTCSLGGRNAFKFLVRKPEFTDHLRDLGLGGRTLTNCVLKKQSMGICSAIIELNNVQR